jgi:hypothetical protein
MRSFIAEYIPLLLRHQQFLGRALQWITKELQASESTILPKANASLGFIIGGTSASGCITSTLTHLARDSQSSPPLTGQMNSMGNVMHLDHVPRKYQSRYLSRTEQTCPCPRRGVLRLPTPPRPSCTALISTTPKPKTGMCKPTAWVCRRRISRAVGRICRGMIS